MIIANTYYLFEQLKNIRIFAISMKNIEFQAKKKARLETNLKNVIQKRY